MTVDERLSHIQAKVERADQLMGGLRSVVQAYIRSSPIEGEAKHDDETKEQVYFIKSVRQPPVAIASIVGDILHDLRSALDHLAHELVVVGTGNGGPHRHVYFPISEDAAKYGVETPGKTKGMHPDAIREIDAIMPYQGGNDVLWRLHSLNIIDKHRTLIIVGSRYRAWNVGKSMTKGMRDLDKQMREAMAAEGKDVSGMGDIADMDIWIAPEDRMFPLKAGDELLRVKDAVAKVNDKEQFTLELAFSEPGVAEGDPLRETLEQMVKTVRKTIERLRPFLT